MRSALTALALVALAMTAAALIRVEAGPDSNFEQSRPIIAGILAEREIYLGRRVEIYGLVVSAEPGGKRFLLQDVSQVPLLVVAPQGTVTTSSDQVIVAGVVRYVDGRLSIVADTIKPARVLAGGGCC